MAPTMKRESGTNEEERKRHQRGRERESAEQDGGGNQCFCHRHGLLPNRPVWLCDFINSPDLFFVLVQSVCVCASVCVTDCVIYYVQEYNNYPLLTSQDF